MIYPTSYASCSRAVLQSAKPKRRPTPTVSITRSMLSTTSLRHKEATSTYANQSKVPRLPVPDLDKSMDAYVRSLVPLLEQKVCHISVGSDTDLSND